MSRNTRKKKLHETKTIFGNSAMAESSSRAESDDRVCLWRDVFHSWMKLRPESAAQLEVASIDLHRKWDQKENELLFFFRGLRQMFTADRFAADVIRITLISSWPRFKIKTFNAGKSVESRAKKNLLIDLSPSTLIVDSPPYLDCACAWSFFTIEAWNSLFFPVINERFGARPEFETIPLRMPIEQTSQGDRSIICHLRNHVHSA